MKNIIELDTGTRQLLSHIHGNIGIITLNRPESKNALSDKLTPALRKQIANLNNFEDFDVKFSVLSPQGKLPNFYIKDKETTFTATMLQNLSDSDSIITSDIILEDNL